MLKMPILVKETERQAAEALVNLLHEIPGIQIEESKAGSPGRDSEVDLVFIVKLAGKTHTLIAEVRQNGQPRFVRQAIYTLQDYTGHFKSSAIPILIAPYLSPLARSICLEKGISYLDLEGNARLAFGTIYIDRSVTDHPRVERRKLRSLFSPKSARVLRVLFRDPHRTWRVTELAQAADVSLGHVSNVRTALRDREWAEVVPEGLRLKSPDHLLDTWKAAYEPPVSRTLRFYTTLHGGEFDQRARAAFAALFQYSRAALASYSAARFIAPYARIATQFLYAELVAVETLERELKLSSSARGENVIISVPNDDGVYLDAFQPTSAPEFRVTSPLQTYLDLSRGGERGVEAAEHLRQEKLKWQI